MKEHTARYPDSAERDQHDPLHNDNINTLPGLGSRALSLSDEQPFVDYWSRIMDEAILEIAVFKMMLLRGNTRNDSLRDAMQMLHNTLPPKEELDEMDIYAFVARCESRAAETDVNDSSVLVKSEYHRRSLNARRSNRSGLTRERTKLTQVTTTSGGEASSSSSADRPGRSSADAQAVTEKATTLATVVEQTEEDKQPTP